jgi:hypothetical protein
MALIDGCGFQERIAEIARKASKKNMPHRVRRLIVRKVARGNRWPSGVGLDWGRTKRAFLEKCVAKGGKMDGAGAAKFN